MNLILLFYLLIRIGIVLLIIFGVVGAIALVDMVLGTSFITVFWQWMMRAIEFAVRFLKGLWKIFLNLLPGMAKRSIIRKLLQGFVKAITSVLAGILFGVLGSRRKKKIIEEIEKRKDATKEKFLKLLWKAELPIPRVVRAGIFVLAVAAFVWAFVKVQEAAVAWNAPTLWGIDLWSFLLGFIGSFILTLPVLGLEHFLALVFRPLQHRYRRVVRIISARARERSNPTGYEWLWTILHWLIFMRPLRRFAEKGRKRHMRQHRSTHGDKGLLDTWIEARKRRQYERFERRLMVSALKWNLAADALLLTFPVVIFLGLLSGAGWLILAGVALVWWVGISLILMRPVRWYELPKFPHTQQFFPAE